MKLIRIFACVMLLLGYSSLIAIKRLNEEDLKEFMLYRSQAIVSPYKYEETVKSPALANYLPVKIKLIGAPTVSLLRH